MQKMRSFQMNLIALTTVPPAGKRLTFRNVNSRPPRKKNKYLDLMKQRPAEWGAGLPDR